MSSVMSSAQSLPREAVELRVNKAIETAVERAVAVKRGDSFVLNLGFDSLRVASLAIALEDQLGEPIQLNDWVAACDDPRALTVGSLYDYVWEIIGENGSRQ